MKKYEYTSHSTALGRSALIDDLNLLGSLGWECFQIDVTLVGAMEIYRVFLKREISG